MSEYQHLKDQFDEISARQKAKQEAPLREEIAALTRRVDELNNAHAAVVSCHHMGEDSACLECMACERYDHHSTQRRLAQVAVELERVAAERDTARELAHDAVEARDRALACEEAGRGLLVELQGRLSVHESELAALRAAVGGRAA